MNQKITSKIISLALYKKAQKNLIVKKKFKENSKMLFFVIALGAFLGFICWNYFVEGVSNLDVQIPQSKNIVFNNEEAISMTTAQVANEFEKADGKPVLLYIYTTWCKVCTKNFPVINEISREFQNTDLQVITLAIDRNLTAEALNQHLNQFGDFYFQPRYLAFKEGFVEFLQKKNINYNNYIPYTALISSNGKVIAKFSGSKNKNYLRNKIIKELYS
jgi:thiol-disulfide isomerase/thioredoxin